ncbi:GNAT family N-acetyltransferase [Variovorax sp. PAMC26660]|uniref:GNAT family N-acetyltransferase n=1 Tax=Variovorax sp. PAMC26660 TaxID=2762322 RepID=UPI00164E4708|nr:GNAT family N-acetyltransferase [Variovorax sp. PAMC26660]QNK65937.1 N-acetyltransferase [Variovorax sp. PAMC26660]
MAFALPVFASLPLRTPRPAELRIDVDPKKGRPSEPLTPVYERMRAMADRLHDLPLLTPNDADLRVRFRQADGEIYVYIEDLRRERLVGYTVFNRLIELGRRADRHIRAPHSQYDPAYQRRGLATAVYRWALASGICLMSGARQSPGANALWQSLARHCEAGFVDLRDKRLSYLGPEIDDVTLAGLHTRMFLLGNGWTLARFRQEAQMT